MCSEETLTPKVNCGEYIIPPYSESFKTKDAFELYKVINSNGDDREWTWSNGVAQYQYSMKNSADDWLLTPPIKLTKGSKYVFSYKAMSKDSKYPEKMEVLYGEGTTLENLKDTLLKETILPSA